MFERSSSLILRHLCLGFLRRWPKAGRCVGQDYQKSEVNRHGLIHEDLKRRRELSERRAAHSMRVQIVLSEP